MLRYAEFVEVAIQPADEKRNRTLHINPDKVVAYRVSPAKATQTEITLDTGIKFVEQDMKTVNQTLIKALHGP